MSRRLRFALAAALAVGAFTLPPGLARAGDFESGDIVRAAYPVGQARVRHALPAATEVLRQATPTVGKLKRARIRLVEREARLMSRRGSRWSRKHWTTFGSDTRVCVASSAFMRSDGMLRDQVLDLTEWRRYAAFGPRRLSEARTRAIKFPIRFDVPLLMSKGREEWFACAIGLGFARYFGKAPAAPR
jgi:hypothetical protein